MGESRPLWARGLKRLLGWGLKSKSSSRPLWARGLKPEIERNALKGIIVAPLVGAWIETA